VAERTLVLKSRTEMFPLTPEIPFVLDGVAQRTVATEAADIAYERCAPVGTFVSWPGKRNYSGSYLSSTTGTHIGFESLFE